MKRLAIAMLVLLGAASQAFAEEPRAELRLEGQPHAGVPFNIAMVIAGFDEQPQPQQPKLEIPGARVTALVCRSLYSAAFDAAIRSRDVTG